MQTNSTEESTALQLSEVKSCESKTQAEVSGIQSLKSLIHTVIHDTEKSAIVEALGRTNWNRKAAARLLRVSYRTILYKIEQYGLTPSQR